jgi:hypothetical protein
MNNEMSKIILREVLSETAEILRTGQTAGKIKIGLTTAGSEVNPLDLLRGAEIAMQQVPGLEVIVIGPVPKCNLQVYEAANEDEVHAVLERLLDEKELDGAVTMHYPFPIGVATIGKVVTPARGRNMYIASTTGTSDTDRIQAMIKNAVLGIAAARADGIAAPSLGILNVEGSRQVERYLNAMKTRGYDFCWGESQRADGGQILRGNDLILGSVDVVVCDTLTGNILMKLFSSFNSGGDYETMGYGYGPGIGENFDRLICIISRASGSPVIAGALSYCASMVSGGLKQIANQEILKAKSAGWEIPAPSAAVQASEEIEPPPAKITAEQIPGIDILELENAVKILWKNNIFASSGMGCTGPIILVAGEDKTNALEILKANQYI